MIDQSKSYGVVLEGGGAKGAFQVGVWKALMESGIQVQAVVGTSVGALNAALFVQNDLDRAIQVWENISYDDVFVIDDQVMEQIQNFSFKDVDWNKFLQPMRQIVKDRGLDIEPLKKLIDEEIHEELVRSSDMQFGLVTYSVSDMKPLEIFIDEIEEGKLNGMLLASSYLPAFKTEKIEGKRYIDGGFHNNSPVTMMVRRNIQDVIVIRLFGIGLEKKAKSPDLKVIEICPSEDLGRILEVDQVRARYNIQMGYYDGLRAVRDLKGNKYYLQADEKEAYYIKKFLRMNKKALQEFRMFFNLEYTSKARMIFEGILPAVAKKMKYRKQWAYEEVFIALIEIAAEEVSISRFNVYNYETLIEDIQNAWKILQEDVAHIKLNNPMSAGILAWLETL